MSRGNLWNLKQKQTAAPASSAFAHFPGLVPPPGLPEPLVFAQKKTPLNITNVDLSVPRSSAPPLGVAPPPGLALIQEKTDVHECGTLSGDARCFSSTSPVYISGMTGALEPEHVSAREATLTDMHKVEVDGLPNAMLSDVMFEAVLHQAKLDGQYASFTTTPGTQFGGASISLYNARAAEQCVHHFQGRPWGPRGATVRAHIVNACPKVSHAPHPLRGVSKYTRGGHFEFKKPFGLSVDAPVFISGTSSFMSPMTPKFRSPTEKRTSHESKSVHTSDMSTVDGESDDDSFNDDGGIGTPCSSRANAARLSATTDFIRVP